MTPAEMVGSGPLVLVNQSHPLEREPDTTSLLPPDDRRPHILLDVRAGTVLNRFLSDLGCTGEIVPVSGYRSRAEQEAIFSDSLRDNGEDFTRSYVALPGCSEHQTGLAIDLGENRPDLDFIRPQFPDTGVFRTFRRRASEYGFILRYPEDKTSITGIQYEPWHFRYMGWPHARLMEREGLVLEEYHRLLEDYPECGPHLHFQEQGRSFEVYTVSRDNLEDLPSRLPKNTLCQWSGNNGSGVVVTIWRDVL
ncbi:MAG: M15 family metallopeptidase [Pseudoflavonifractor capillosus]|uniref:M15 family metallopeptidase n=1 Tax=Pseudoflavonifractor capillosus TaxID=106588 RepID=UPI0023F7DCA1|nr:M15 family metallopeptidase [Pseudoflavonifractor capillosus]MCI5927462.1 M15 family metallopeptidase [Pseudoflavonifractor capillosus]MDY4661435.1 M15 family metallopeptidase [Pseudoflavonifractor capillosus]